MKLHVNGEYVTVRVVVSDQLINDVDVLKVTMGGVTVTDGKACSVAFDVVSVRKLSIGLVVRVKMSVQELLLQIQISMLCLMDRNGQSNCFGRIVNL